MQILKPPPLGKALPKGQVKALRTSLPQKTSTPFGFMMAAGAMALVGCAQINPGTQPTERGPVRKAVRPQQEILHTPGMLKQEYCFPENAARMRFSWGKSGCAWTLNIQNPEIRYAGFHIRKSFDLADVTNETLLHFKLRPASAADQLSLILIEGSDRARTPQSKTLAAYQTDLDHQGWAKYQIPLNEFIPVTDLMFTQSGEFNWDDVRQIRLSNNAPHLSHDEIQIHHMGLRGSSAANAEHR